MGEIKAKSGSWRQSGAMVILIAVLALLPSCSAKKAPTLDGRASSGPAKVTAVKVETGEKQDIILITTDPNSVPYNVTRWTEPARVVVEVPNAVVAGVPATSPVTDGYIQEVEVREIKAPGATVPTVRIVVNLKQTMEFKAERDRTNGQLVIALDRAPIVNTSQDLMATAPETGIVLVQAGNTGDITPVTEDWAWSGPTASPATPAGHAPAAGSGRNIKDIAVKTESGLTRVNIVMDGGVGDYSAFVLAKPDRLVVDIWGLKVNRGLEERSINAQGIQQVRVGQHPDKVRLVFDASGALPFYRFDKSGDRLVITFSRTVNLSATPEAASSATASAAAASVGSPAHAASARAASAASPASDWPVMSLAENNTEWGGAQSGNSAAAAPAAGAPSAAAPATAAPASPSAPLDWGPTPAAPTMAEPGRVGIAYIDSVKFDYSNDSSSIIIHSDRPLRRDQWTRNDNPDENIVSIFITGAQVAADQQRSYDTTEFQSPIELFSVFQRPSTTNEVAIVIVMRSASTSKWSQSEGKLVFQFENAPGALGAGGPSSGYMGPNGESMTGPGGVTGSATIGAPPAAGMSQYTGASISLDFKNMDILDALRTIAEVSGVNMVVSDDVRGKITIKLDNVPWDQALDIILETKGLGKKESGNIMRIAPKEIFAQEAESTFRQNMMKEGAEPLMIKIIPVNYLNAEELRRVLEPLVTQGRGKVDAYKRTNSIIIRDVPKVVADVEELIRKLDHPTKQVLIEARIVEATVGITNELGVFWGANANVGSATGTPTGLNFPNSVQVGGATLGSPGIASASAASASAGGGAIGLTVGSLSGVGDLDVMLRALEAREKIKIISSPRVVTITDERATIQQGISIPYPPPSYTTGSVGWTFVEASLELEVTPHVASDNSITMEVKAANNEPVNIPGATAPGISRKEAETTILVKDGETAVIGGIFKLNQSSPSSGVPFLSQLPYIGWLFRDQTETTRNEELIIFLTPTVINPGSGMESVSIGSGSGM